MKKLLVLSAMCLAMTAQATILRVSNRTNSGAPYSSISDAISAAEEGDTIMVDGSNTSYGNITITKRLVLIGPGYLLNANGVIAEGSPSAMLGTVSSNYNGAIGSTIMGFDIKEIVTLSQPNMIVTRCRLAADLRIAISASNCIIHQNYFIGGRVMCVSSSTTSWVPNAQITNNIFATPNDLSSSAMIQRISNGTIAYNTFTKQASGNDYYNIANLTGCTVEHNIFVGSEITMDGNSIHDNSWSGSPTFSYLNDCATEMDVKNMTSVPNYEGMGAFAGTDPYVISGIPAGPYISDITVPTSVEQGQTLKVNVKLGVQQ